MDTNYFNISYLVSKIQVNIILYIVILTLFLKYIADKCRRDSRFLKLAESLPGPYALPIIGNSLNFLLVGKDGPIVQQTKYSKKYGSMYRVWIGNQLLVVLSDIADIQVVFQSSKMLGKCIVLNESFHEFLGNGLFTIQSVQQWKADRKPLQQFFTKNAVSSSTSVINVYVQKFIERLKKRVNGPEFDIADSCFSLAFDISSRIILNYETQPGEKSALNLQANMNRVTLITSLQMFLPILKTRFMNYVIYKTIMGSLKDKFRKFIKKAIANDLDLIKKKIKTVEQDKEFYRSSILALLYKLKEETGDEEKIIEQLLILLLAGTETTSITHSFTLLMIAMHPEIQERLYNEIYQVFGDDDRRADYCDIERLTYLDQVLKEVTRRFTLTPFIFREVEEVAKIGSHVLPAGTGLLINIATVHFNEKYFPQPHKFNPENFSIEAVNKRPKYSWIPFSAGARICIGKQLAETELKLAVVELLRNFSIHTSRKMEDIKLNIGFVAHSDNGYPISLKWRNSKKQSI